MSIFQKSEVEMSQKFFILFYSLAMLDLESSRVKVCMVVENGLNEGDGEEGDRIVDRAGNGYRLCILGDLSGGIVVRTRASITGAFGIPGENDNGVE